MRTSLWLGKSGGSAQFSSRQNFRVPLNIPKCDNYQNVVYVGGNVVTNTAKTTPTYLSSAYANPNYMANALFVTARYNVQRRMERMD